jgi:hypothetical protein
VGGGGLGPMPQSPIPNPQSPFFILYIAYLLFLFISLLL